MVGIPAPSVFMLNLKQFQTMPINEKKRSLKTSRYSSTIFYKNVGANITNMLFRDDSACSDDFMKDLTLNYFQSPTVSPLTLVRV